MFHLAYLNIEKHTCVRYITNWRVVQRKNIVNNVARSSLEATWKNDPHEDKHIEQHKHAEQQDVSNSQNKL